MADRSGASLSGDVPRWNLTTGGLKEFEISVREFVATTHPSQRSQCGPLLMSMYEAESEVGRLLTTLGTEHVRKICQDGTAGPDLIVKALHDRYGGRTPVEGQNVAQTFFRELQQCSFCPCDHSFGSEAFCCFGGPSPVCQHCMAECGCPWIANLEYLIEMKVDVNGMSRGGHTALLIAARQGQLRIVFALLKLKADNLSSADHRRWTPLHEAAKHRRGDICKALLAQHSELIAPPDREEESSMRSLQDSAGRPQASSTRPAPSVVQVRGGSRNGSRTRARAVATRREPYASRRPTKDRASVLLSNERCSEDAPLLGTTPFLEAVAAASSSCKKPQSSDGRVQGTEDVIDCMLVLKADVNRARVDGTTALMIAVVNANFGVCKKLLDHRCFVCASKCRGKCKDDLHEPLRNFGKADRKSALALALQRSRDSPLFEEVTKLLRRHGVK